MSRLEARENLRLAIPIVLTQLGTMAMGLVDTAIVGRVNETELAGVALGNTLSFAMVMPALGIFAAIEPLASQAVGGKDGARARMVLRVGTRLALLLTIPFVLLTFASTALFRLLDVAPAIVPIARAYMLARLPSILPFFVYSVWRTYQQAALRPRAAVEAVVIANVVNAAAGYVLVFGDPGLRKLGLPAIGLTAHGGAGVGVATAIATFVMALWIGPVRGRIPAGAVDAIAVDRREPEPIFDRALARKMLRVGVPIGLQLSAEVGVFTLVTLLMGHIGSRATAAHQIALNLASFSFMGALGVAQATSVRVGLAIGERSKGGPRRAGATGIALGVSVMTLWSILFALFPAQLARVFTNDPEVVSAAVPLIRIASLFQLFDGAQVVSAGALRGAGDTRWPLVANVVVHWLIGLPIGCALAFAAKLHAVGLWFGLTAGLVVIGAALMVRFFRLTRRDLVAL